jgi:hypothetical protein
MAWMKARAMAKAINPSSIGRILWNEIWHPLWQHSDGMCNKNLCPLLDG